MVSNFLGDVGTSRRGSYIISAAELIAREGVNLQKGMTYRDTGPLLSVFLVLPRESCFRDEWDEENRHYIYEGHDSTTAESGKAADQLMMYESGRVSDNGKFYKAAHAFIDGIRKEPMRVQVYEKLGAGVWFDKGIFELIDARRVDEGGRKVFKFHLFPIGAAEQDERMMPAAAKEEAWRHCGGRCSECGSEMGLHFAGQSGDGEVRLLCAAHGGGAVGLL